MHTTCNRFYGSAWGLRPGCAAAALRCDGSACMQTMPLITVAKFRVEFLWRVAQAGGRAHVQVWVRSHFLKPSFLRATISSQSVSQGISCYTQLRQRLMLRFPPQGSAPDTRNHIADISFALRIAKDAAARMPRGATPRLPGRLAPLRGLCVLGAMPDM